MTFVRRHPLASFFAIAYGLTWAGWVPLALAGVRIYPGSSTTHVPGLLGPALAALIVTSATEGKAGVSALIRRLFLVTRPRIRFLAYALSPLVFLVAALAIGVLAGADLPPLGDYGIYSGIPPLGVIPVIALVLVFNGFGEETGWRGFAQPRLQARFGPLTGTLVLALLWAGWHAPAFFFIEAYRTMTLPMILGGFVLGIAAGAVVLAEVTSRTGGSVLAAALWHAAYNLTSATAAGRGIVAAVTTTCVMIWGVALLSRGALSARRDRVASVFFIGSAAGSKSGKEELCQSPQQIR
jgi:CAAX protease family protein